MLTNVKAGDALPAFTTEPLTRHTLALYCGASGDHNPIMSTSTSPAPPACPT